MSTLLFSLSLGQLATGTALMIIGSLAACLLTMSQWFIHRRAIATGFLVSVTILLSFYTWAFAITIIHSQAGIFILNDHHFGWFVLVCLGLGAIGVGRTYRYTLLPLMIALLFLLPPVINLGGVWVVLTAGAFSTSWLCVQVWREWQLLMHDLSPFSVKEALDRLEHGVLFSDSRGHNKLVNLRMERLLSSLNLSPLTRYGTLGKQLRQLATDKIVIGDSYSTPAKSEAEVSENTSFRIDDSQGKTWILRRTQISDKHRYFTQLIALDVTNYMTLSQKLSDGINDLQARQKRLAKETVRLEKALTSNLVLQTRCSIHDVLSQRISFVHRFLEDGVADGERLLQLQRLLANLPTDLTHNRQQIPASVWLNSLQTLASAVKLDLQIEGQLPTDEHKAHLFLRVLREAITNVLIHTTATEMQVKLGQDTQKYCLEISNPGTVSSPVSYGTGLSGLEARLEAAGGSLQVLTIPIFTLKAYLPKPR